MLAYLLTALYIIVAIYIVGVFQALMYILFWNMESHMPDSKFEPIDGQLALRSWFFKNPHKKK